MHAGGLMRRNWRHVPVKALAAVAPLFASQNTTVGKFGENASRKAQTYACVVRSRRSVSQFERDLTRTANRQPDRFLRRDDFQRLSRPRGFGNGSDTQV